MLDADCSPQNAPILVATDAVADAELVATLLSDEFENIRLSIKPENAISDFEAHRPAVLVLAFDTLEAAQQYYLGLYRLSKVAQAVPHRTLILCSKNDLWRVYELCKKGHFDDYVLFWPITNDAPRLRMAMHHALHRLKAALLHPVTVSQLAVRAHPLAALEPELAQYASKIGQHVDVAGLTIRQAEHALKRAFDELLEEVPDDAGSHMSRRLGRVKIDNVLEHFRSIADAIDAVRGATTDAGRNIGARLAPMRAMVELARQVRPVVLMVDDDDFQQKLVARALAGQNIELVFASSSAEVMALLWRHRPNLVLMDVGLPDVDGIETTRRIRDIANFSDMQIIMVTGHSERNVVVESLRAGAVDFLVKPLERAKLLDKLRTFFPITTSP
jgi:CheY-like chemotaxis protein